jgi:O-antigen/teichoic acid export membrane protein
VLLNFFKAVSLLWVASLTGAGLAFFTQVILARQLSAELYGMFSSAWALVLMVAPLAGFGAAQTVVRIYGQEGAYGARWLTSLLKYVVASSLVMMFVSSMGFLFFLENGAELNVAFLLLPCAMAQLGIELLSAKFQLKEQYSFLALWQFAPHALRFICVALLYSVGTAGHLYVIAIVYCVIGVLTFMASMWLCDIKKALPSHRGFNEAGLQVSQALNAPTVYNFLILAWPYGFASFFFLLYFQSAVIVVRIFEGLESAGSYNVALVVMTAIYLLPTTIYQKFLAPKINRWAWHDFESLKAVYSLGSVGMLSVGVLAMGLLLLLGDDLVGLMFGFKYHAAGSILAILAYSVPVRFLATSVGSVLVSTMNMRRKALCMSIAAGLNIALGVLFVFYWGACGGAYAMLVSEVALLLMYWHCARSYVFKEMA